jgi:flagella basal body P-ring formation protein FlgA
MRRRVLLVALLTPLAASATAQVADGPVSPVLQARMAMAVAGRWGVDTAGLVLAWGTGSLAGAPDSSLFRLLGGGDGGWFAVVVESPGRAPMAIRLRAGVAGRRQVAARALAAGQVLTPADIRSEAHVRWGPPPGAPLAPVEAGWVVRRRLVPGAVLDGSRVGPAPVVSAGETVQVHWNTGSVSVALEGVALHDAALGAPLRVRTTRKRGVLQTTVIAPGEARMN